MIATWSVGVADESMDEAILVELAGLVGRHPWWRARTRLTLDLLARLGVAPPATVLDAGCGWGTTLEALEGAGYRVTGADISRRALGRLDRPGRSLAVVDLGRPLPPGLPEFDAVLALDVIEHVDDDRGAVARLGALVAPGGLVIVSVPARPELWSEFDEVQGHRRRYRPETLRLAFEESGLAVESVRWWGRWMVPVLNLQRRRRRPRRSVSAGTPAEVYAGYLRLPPWPARWVFERLYALEHRPTLAGELRAGTSLIAVARRPP